MDPSPEEFCGVLHKQVEIGRLARERRDGASRFRLLTWFVSWMRRGVLVVALVVEAKTRVMTGLEAGGWIDGDVKQGGEMGESLLWVEVGRLIWDMDLLF